MTPEKLEIINRMENLLLIPYHSNPFWKNEEHWRSEIQTKIQELKSNKIK